MQVNISIERLQVLSVEGRILGTSIVAPKFRVYCGICGSDISAYKTGNYVVGLTIRNEFSGEYARI